MITAEQANAISFKNSFEKDQVYLDEILALIEHKANLGKYRLVYTISGPVTSLQYIHKQLQNLGFNVGYGIDKNELGHKFVIEW